MHREFPFPCEEIFKKWSTFAEVKTKIKCTSFLNTVYVSSVSIGTPYCYVTSQQSGQLSLLASAGREMGVRPPRGSGSSAVRIGK